MRYFRTLLLVVILALVGATGAAALHPDFCPSGVAAR